MKSREGRIIYYDGTGTRTPPAEGGYTVGEWLVFWTWQYLIGRISALELEQRFDYIRPEMAGALDPEEWDENVEYLQRLGRAA